MSYSRSDSRDNSLDRSGTRKRFSSWDDDDISDVQLTSSFRNRSEDRETSRRIDRDRSDSRDSYRRDDYSRDDYRRDDYRRDDYRRDAYRRDDYRRDDYSRDSNRNYRRDDYRRDRERSYSDRSSLRNYDENSWDKDSNDDNSSRNHSYSREKRDNYKGDKREDRYLDRDRDRSRYSDRNQSDDNSPYSQSSSSSNTSISIKNEDTSLHSDNSRATVTRISSARPVKVISVSNAGKREDSFISIPELKPENEPSPLRENITLNDSTMSKYAHRENDESQVSSFMKSPDQAIKKNPMSELEDDDEFETIESLSKKSLNDGVQPNEDHQNEKNKLISTSSYLEDDDEEDKNFKHNSFQDINSDDDLPATNQFGINTPEGKKDSMVHLSQANISSIINDNTNVSSNGALLSPVNNNSTLNLSQNISLVKPDRVTSLIVNDKEMLSNIQKNNDASFFALTSLGDEVSDAKSPQNSPIKPIKPASLSPRPDIKDHANSSDLISSQESISFPLKSINLDENEKLIPDGSTGKEKDKKKKSNSFSFFRSSKSDFEKEEKNRLKAEKKAIENAEKAINLVSSIDVDNKKEKKRNSFSIFKGGTRERSDSISSKDSLNSNKYASDNEKAQISNANSQNLSKTLSKSDLPPAPVQSQSSSNIPKLEKKHSGIFSKFKSSFKKKSKENSLTSSQDDSDRSDDLNEYEEGQFINNYVSHEEKDNELTSDALKLHNDSFNNYNAQDVHESDYGSETSSVKKKKSFSKMIGFSSLKKALSRTSSSNSLNKEDQTTNKPTQQTESQIGIPQIPIASSLNPYSSTNNIQSSHVGIANKDVSFIYEDNKSDSGYEDEANPIDLSQSLNLNPSPVISYHENRYGKISENQTIKPISPQKPNLEYKYENKYSTIQGNLVEPDIHVNKKSFYDQKSNSLTDRKFDNHSVISPSLDQYKDEYPSNIQPKINTNTTKSYSSIDRTNSSNEVRNVSPPTFQTKPIKSQENKKLELVNPTSSQSLNGIPIIADEKFNLNNDLKHINKNNTKVNSKKIKSGKGIAKIIHNSALRSENNKKNSFTASSSKIQELYEKSTSLPYTSVNAALRTKMAIEQLSLQERLNDFKGEVSINQKLHDLIVKSQDMSKVYQGVLWNLPNKIAEKGKTIYPDFKSSVSKESKKSNSKSLSIYDELQIFYGVDQNDQSKQIDNQDINEDDFDLKFDLSRNNHHLKRINPKYSSLHLSAKHHVITDKLGRKYLSLVSPETDQNFVDEETLLETFNDIKEQFEPKSKNFLSDCQIDEIREFVQNYKDKYGFSNSVEAIEKQTFYKYDDLSFLNKMTKIHGYGISRRNNSGKTNFFTSDLVPKYLKDNDEDNYVDNNNERLSGWKAEVLDVLQTIDSKRSSKLTHQIYKNNILSGLLPIYDPYYSLRGMYIQDEHKKNIIKYLSESELSMGIFFKGYLRKVRTLTSKNRFYAIILSPFANSNLNDRHLNNSQVYSNPQALKELPLPFTTNSIYFLAEYEKSVNSMWGICPLNLKYIYPLEDLVSISTNPSKKKKGKYFTLSFILKNPYHHQYYSLLYKGTSNRDKSQTIDDSLFQSRKSSRLLSVDSSHLPSPQMSVNSDSNDVNTDLSDSDNNSVKSKKLKKTFSFLRRKKTKNNPPTSLPSSLLNENNLNSNIINDNINNPSDESTQKIEMEITPKTVSNLYSSLEIDTKIDLDDKDEIESIQSNNESNDGIESLEGEPIYFMKDSKFIRNVDPVELEKENQLFLKISKNKKNEPNLSSPLFNSYKMDSMVQFDLNLMADNSTERLQWIKILQTIVGAQPTTKEAFMYGSMPANIKTRNNMGNFSQESD